MEFGRLTAKFLGEFANARGKRRWVDKTPNYYRLLSLIDRMFQHQVTYLFLVRHPLDTVESLDKVIAFASKQPEDPEIARAIRLFGRGHECWARYWLEVNRQLLAYAEANPRRSLIVKYEHLVTSTDVTLETVFRFLGEPVPPTLVADAFSQSHAPGYSDWNIARVGGIHSRSIAKWTSWPPELISHLWGIVGTLAQQLGYDHP
jgi:hypothetical protein